MLQQISGSNNRELSLNSSSDLAKSDSGKPLSIITNPSGDYAVSAGGLLNFVSPLLTRGIKVLSSTFISMKPLDCCDSGVFPPTKALLLALTIVVRSFSGCRYLFRQSQAPTATCSSLMHQSTIQKIPRSGIKHDSKFYPQCNQQCG